MTLDAGADAGKAAEVTYLTIRRQILSGERAGGEWLREGDLAAVIGVSRTPVREALRRLAAEGLVRHEPNRGVQVEDWGVGDLDEIFSLRSQLEPWGCGLAATTGGADLELLAGLADGMDREARRVPPDLDAITELNNRFHRAILEASGNTRLVGLVSSVVEVPLVWRTFSHYSAEAMQRSLAHHHEIVHALRAGDAVWAESVMRAHVRAAWVTLREERGGEPSLDQPARP
ncbi:GntR family transcriptional regulator [Nocardioides sp. zg-1228]|uniref:GntR family transcriptional regulator n=1 Tax=Nocardioides sp. zg-1228 TaxID=2763008 RepID=UPI0016428EF5|nr:GntR family transcriptional regulator [Nocardioides sp. zg-1228]MBC2934169.1 GntR family transcriptional regulator [Nocardioides sp. zg-1228]QSF58914.1 GntR family transcriptional regulator [Nocardioides sp. zg-1228]